VIYKYRYRNTSQYWRGGFRENFTIETSNNSGVPYWRYSGLFSYIHWHRNWLKKLNLLIEYLKKAWIFIKQSTRGMGIINMAAVFLAPTEHPLIALSSMFPVIIV